VYFPGHHRLAAVHLISNAMVTVNQWVEITVDSNLKRGYVLKFIVVVSGMQLTIA